MKRKKKDGVLLESVRADRENGMSLPGILIRFFMVFAGVYGALFLLADGLELEIDRPMLTLVIAGMTAVLYAAFALQRYLWFSMSVSFLFLSVYAIREWDLMRDGFWHLLNAYIDRYNEYMRTDVSHYVTSTDEKRALLCLLILLSYFTALLYVMSFYGVISRYLLLAATIPFFGAGLTVGIVPPAVPFLCYLCSMLFLTAAKRSADYGNWGIRRTVSAAGLCAVALGALLFVFLDRLVGDGGYPEEAIRERKLETLEAMEDFPPENLAMWMEYRAFPDLTRTLDDLGVLELFGVSASGDGGLAGGRLGRVDRVEFDYETALRITLPDLTGGFYLKGYVGANYTGNRWDGLNEEAEARLLEFERKWEDIGYPFDTKNQIAKLYQILGEYEELRMFYSETFGGIITNYFMQGTGRVDVVSANPYFYYLPYGTDSSSFEDGSESLYVRPDRSVSEYSFSYYSSDQQFPNGFWYYPSLWENTGVEEMDAWIEAEEEYAGLAEEMYLQVPEYTAAVLEPVVSNLAQRIDFMKEAWLDRGYITAEDIRYRDYIRSRDLVITIQAVREYLAENMTYTLSPGRLPAGEDFVSYFLTGSGQGYCSHFASAGVILLRMLGVPARYAEGYLISGSDVASAVTAGRQNVTTYERYVSQTRVPNLEISVPDANAHAWAEVYIRGYGWIPVELTAGYEEIMWGQNPAIEEAQSSAAESESGSEEAVTESESQEDETEQNETQPQSMTETQIETEPEAPQEDGPAGEENGDRTVKGRDIAEIAGWIAAGFTIIALGLAFFWGDRLVKKRIRERIYADERNEAVLFLYRRALRMLRIMKIVPGIAEDDPKYGAQIGERLEEITQAGAEAKSFMEIVVRAEYSGRMVTMKDRDDAVRFYEELKKGYYTSVSPVWKFCGRFLWNL